MNSVEQGISSLRHVSQSANIPPSPCLRINLINDIIAFSNLKQVERFYETKQTSFCSDGSKKYKLIRGILFMKAIKITYFEAFISIYSMCFSLWMKISLMKLKKLKI